MPRVCLVLETEEESGSDHLLELLTMAKDAIGKPDYLFCMDSGCIDYEHLWMTSSLRGVAIMDIEIKLGEQNYHSGEVGGIVPETFRILRVLLDRLDSSKDGSVMKELQEECPEWKHKEAEYLTTLKGMDLCTKFPIVDGSKYAIHAGGLKDMYLTNVWGPNLAITGIDGIPNISSAGNVVRSSTSVRLSMRLCPLTNPDEALKIMKEALQKDIPYNAQVTILSENGGSGWCMKELQPATKKAID